MKVFQKKELKHVKILNPSQTSKPIKNQRLYTFFDDLSFPHIPNSLVGIYLSFYFLDIDPIKSENIYYKISPRIIEFMQNYLDIGDVEIIELKPATYFLVMCNIDENTILSAIFLLKKDIEKRTLSYQNKEYNLKLRCGLYLTGPYIDAEKFYELTKQQYQLAYMHNNFLSIYNDCVDDLDFE